MTMVYPKAIVLIRNENIKDAENATAEEIKQRVITIEPNTEFSIERKKEYDSETGRKKLVMEVGCAVTLNVSYPTNA